MQRTKHLTAILLALLLAMPLLAGACGKSVGDTIDDATITTRVKTALLNDPVVGGLRIDVDTFKGVVTLSGTADSKDTRDKAGQAAADVQGVKSVNNRINVLSGS